MGANFTLCCCHFYLKPNKEEKRAILRMHKTPSSRRPELLLSESSDSDTGEESLFGPPASGRSPLRNKQNQSRTADPSVTTNRPDISCFRRGSDRELQAFISMRNQADTATEEWERLNYDIHTLRYTRREVRSRWRKILLQLGFQREVDSLLYVKQQSWFHPDQEHLHKATDFLKQLLDHTSLFPTGTEHHSRYLQDRLVSLDSAEEFIRLAKEKYPKKER